MLQRTALALLALILVPTAASASLLRPRCAWTGSAFDPTSNKVKMTPIVIDLDRDGASDIVFVSEDHAGPQVGVLRAISGADCREMFSTGAVGCRTCFDDVACHDLDAGGDGRILLPHALAAGDLDGDGAIEIVGLLESDDPWTFSQRIVVYDASGQFQWCSARVPPQANGNPDGFGSIQISLADLDGDGRSEILVGRHVFTAEGALFAYNDLRELRAPSVAADVDGDGQPEIVLGGAVLSSTGALRWHRTDLMNFITSSFIPGCAIVDLERDGLPEIVVGHDWLHQVLVLDAITGATRAEGAFSRTGCAFWRPNIGTPAVGDLDADGAPEIVVATSDEVCAWTWSGSLVPRWCSPITDCSSGSLAPVLADLDGDGSLEVVVRDEETLHVFAADGSTIQALPSSSGTLDESVAVADVDGDCSGEVIVSESEVPWSSFTGIRIFEGDSAPLAGQRAIWNQPAYHGGNVLDDGSIPRTEAPATAWLAQQLTVAPGAPLTASRTTLWPPNHRMVRIHLDAGDDAVRVLGVYQDEPVDERGDGRTGPDAIVAGDDVLLLRAERSGRGNGRVYHVRVAVGDGACAREDEITVCVPHDVRRRTGTCVDDGAVHESTVR